MNPTARLKTAVNKQDRFKLIGDFISNTHWAAKRGWFKDGGALDESAVKALLPNVEVATMAQEALKSIVPDAPARARYDRTPLVWCGPDYECVCFLATDGKRAWFQRTYVEQFPVEALYGSHPDLAFTDEPKDYSFVLMPRRVPEGEMAERVFGATKSPIAPEGTKTAPKKRADRLDRATGKCSIANCPYRTVLLVRGSGDPEYCEEHAATTAPATAPTVEAPSNETNQAVDWI